MNPRFFYMKDTGASALCNECAGLSPWGDKFTDDRNYGDAGNYGEITQDEYEIHLVMDA